MREMLPEGPELADASTLIRTLGSDRPEPRPDRPAVSTNMVASLDGAYAVDGRSAALGSPGDRTMFHAVRSLADAIVVGAGTVRAERYRRPRAEGRSAAPLLVVTTRRADLPADLPLVQGPPPAPIVACPEEADTTTLPDGLEVLRCGTGDVDLRRLLAVLRERGVHNVVCEGGPALLGQLAQLDLIDEFLLTLSPRLVGGARVGLLGGVEVDTDAFGLHRVLRDGDHLLLSYRRR